MFERFTDKARRTVVLCQEEARRYNHHSIGTEHLLLALTDDDNTVAHLALTYLKADFEKLRADVLAATGEGATPAMGHIPFTTATKRTLELALREALEQGVNYIAAEHLLLGLLRSGDGTGADVLAAHGITHEAVRNQVAQITGAVFPGQPLTLHQAGDTVYPTREQAEVAAGGAGEPAEVRVELRPGEAFAIAHKETGTVLSSYSLDYASMFEEALASRLSEVVVMRPVMEDVYALDAAGRRVRIGATTEYVAIPLKLRTRPV